ncbi:unnamed protein product [Anisakis simplex]|uniref:Suppressor of presenilin protein 4 (inferred by orthology to a C. elegans protein) n=1 Tax=Anisakis simplex TaxID=6269 RepID=A0A158PNR8_ANISI|nr:unnamed protein product [Anisakis simplex]
MASTSANDSLRRSKRNKFHLDVAAIMSQHSDRHFIANKDYVFDVKRSVSPPSAASRKRNNVESQKVNATGKSTAIKTFSAAMGGKRERKTPARHIDFIPDDHLEPESDDETLSSDKLRDVKRDYYCSHCPAHYQTRTGLANHSKQHGSMKKYHCEACDMSCDSLKTLRVHTQVHLVREQCQSSANSSSVKNETDDVDEQLSNCTSSKTQFVCKECPFRTRDTGRLNAHTEGHKRDRGFQCPMCTYRSVYFIGIVMLTPAISSFFDEIWEENFIHLDRTVRLSESAGFLRRHCDCHGVRGYRWPPMYVGRGNTNSSKKNTILFASSTEDLVNERRSESSASLSEMKRNKETRKESSVKLSVRRTSTTPPRLSDAVWSCDAEHSAVASAAKDSSIDEGPSSTKASPSSFLQNTNYYGARSSFHYPNKSSIRYQQNSVKACAKNDPRKYKCFCCSARFLSYYERSAHRFSCRKAPRISKRIYSSLLKERTNTNEIPSNSSEASLKEQRIHNCAYCPFTCTQKSRLKRHENKHFVKAENQLKHSVYVLHINMRKLITVLVIQQCADCTFSCRSVEILTQHSRLHQTNKNVQMPGRRKDFALTDEALSNGSVSFPIGKVGKCSECPYRSRHLCDMKAHAAMHVGIREFACNRCTYSTKRAHVLEAHLQMHAEEDGLPPSSQKINLNFLVKKYIPIRWHGIIIGMKSGAKLTRLYSCNFCPYRTRFCAPLFAHFRFITACIHFIFCMIFYCVYKIELINNSRNHMGSRSLRCSRCTFNTSIKRKFTEHLSLHPSPRTTTTPSNANSDTLFICRFELISGFRAGECPYTCDSYGKLWHHGQKHKKTARFMCDLCSFSTGTSSSLSEHRALHKRNTSAPTLEPNMDDVITINETNSAKSGSETVCMDVPNEHIRNVQPSGNDEEACTAIESNSNNNNSLISSYPMLVKKLAGGIMKESESEMSSITHDSSSRYLFSEEDVNDSFISNEMKLLMRIRKSHSDLLGQSIAVVSSGKSYRCNECPFVCEDKILLAFHLDRHKSKGGPLKCNLCSYKAYTPEALCNHINLHINTYSQNASVAAFRKRKLRHSSPEAISHEGKVMKCSKCPFQTASTDRYTAHCLEHALRIQRRLETSIRRNKSNSGDNRKQKIHRMARRIDGQHFCWKCSFHCDSESALGTHMELHGLHAPFVCSLCDYASFSNNVIIFHQMNHHVNAPLTNLCKPNALNDQKNILEMAYTEKTQLMLRCNRCGLIVNNFNEFMTHCNCVHQDLSATMKGSPTTQTIIENASRIKSLNEDIQLNNDFSSSLSSQNKSYCSS